MAKVIAGFRDKVTHKIHTIGSEYTGERVEELTKAGFLKKEPKTKTKKKAK
ncbi:hypothetical protein Si049_01139 [Streptococcus infantarius subsp. infantarius]|nr:hypothetical protein [Streptococcus infantarius subsp. infantarius]MCO4638356.1 hypothetical protein [Streptococcus infantarius subsp. infantarius]MCO4641658.1 hypothetical protein [Streptococcus infantarius subsp. infantarius]MCO4643451.1 hypothetical protein [Streptococcus infantarius subsp. infantarius]